MAFDPYKNSHYEAPGSTPTPQSTWAPLDKVPMEVNRGSGNDYTREALEKALPYLNGEPEYLAKRQLAAIKKK